MEKVEFELAQRTQRWVKRVVVFEIWEWRSNSEESSLTGRQYVCQVENGFMQVIPGL